MTKPTRSSYFTMLLFFLSLPLLHHHHLLLLPTSAASPSQLPASQDTEANASRTSKQQQTHAHEIHCSRERSRAARKVIEEYLMPFVEKEKYQISRECRLHPDNDMFRDQEQHKVHVDIHEWQCGYCKKSFYEEKYLDMHFDNRHYDLLDLNGTKCVADSCGALHCDLIMDIQRPKSKCNPAAAARSHQLCESLADTCFPISGGPSSSRLHEFFMRQFCDAHTCSKGIKPFSRGGKKRLSIFYLSISILTLMLLPLFYIFVYLYQRGLRRGTQDLKRISKTTGKKKPY